MARLAFEQALIVISSGEKDPTTYRMATTGMNKKEWTEAVLNELQGHTAKGTWRLARLPQGRRMVGCRWVFVTKRDADGKPIKRKARLVAQGFSQQEGIDFDKTFSPVGRSITLRAMLAIGAITRWMVSNGVDVMVPAAPWHPPFRCIRPASQRC